MASPDEHAHGRRSRWITARRRGHEAWSRCALRRPKPCGYRLPTQRGMFRRDRVLLPGNCLVGLTRHTRRCLRLSRIKLVERANQNGPHKLDRILGTQTHDADRRTVLNDHVNHEAAHERIWRGVAIQVLDDGGCEAGEEIQMLISLRAPQPPRNLGDDHVLEPHIVQVIAEKPVRQQVVPIR